jgi:hypothetical protein
MMICWKILICFTLRGAFTTIFRGAAAAARFSYSVLGSEFQSLKHRVDQPYGLKCQYFEEKIDFWVNDDLRRGWVKTRLRENINKKYVKKFY